MERKENTIFIKKNYILILLTMIFVAPFLLIGNEIDLFHAFFSGLIGFSIGKEIVEYFKNNNRKKTSKDVWLSLPTILKYCFVYVLFFLYLNLGKPYYTFFHEDLSSFLFWAVMGLGFFFAGFKVLQTKEVYIRGFKYEGPATIFWAILAFIASLFFLFAGVILK